MILKIRIQILFCCFMLLFNYCGFAQHKPNYNNDINVNLSLDELVNIVREQSPSAMIAKHNFLVNYWSYRTYKAEFLPSLNMSSNIGNYQRNLATVQNSETGQLKYVHNNYMDNRLKLSVDQNVALTGGQISLYTSLYRLDQFSPHSIIYNSQPINISFTQPIKSYNSLKWDKKIEPKKYEMAQREYLESIEDITSTAVGYFFSLLLAYKSLEIAKASRANTDMLYEIAKERFKIGTISKNELLELHLKLLNDSLSISDNELKVEVQMIKLRNYLGYNERVRLNISVPEKIPSLIVDVDDLMQKYESNSSYILSNDITKLSALKDIAKAKSENGLQASFYAQFGLNQVGNKLGAAYKSPLDQDIMGLSLSMPIIDWGLGQGRIKIAKSKAKVIEMQMKQDMNIKKENITYKVMQFNIQSRQCAISIKADSIGKLRYDFAKQRFMNGTIGVMELNNAQNEMDNASMRYIENLSNYWVYYFNIRKIGLYDFITDKKLQMNFTPD